MLGINNEFIWYFAPAYKSILGEGVKINSFQLIVFNIQNQI